MAEQSIQDQPTEITAADLPQQLSDYVAKAEAAIQQDNHGYAVKLLLAVVKTEPRFVEGRQKLRDSQMKVAGPPKKKGLLGGGGLKMKLSGQAKKDPVGVMETIEKELDKDPYNAAANEILFECALRANMLETAAFALETVRKGTPDNTKLLHKLAEFYLNRGMPDAAAAVYKDIVKVDQSDTDAIKGEKDATAQASMQRSQDSSGNLTKKDDAATLELEKGARSAMTRDQLEERRDQLIEQYSEDVNNLDVVKKLAAIYEQLEDWEMAQQMFEWAFSLSPGDVALKNHATHMKDRVGEAELADLRQRVEDNPEDEEAKAKLEEYEMGRITEMVEERRKRVEQNPTDPHLRFDLGQALHRAGEYSDAIPHLQQATRNPHIRTKVLLQLGRTFEAKGMNDMAVKQLTDANADLQTMDKTKKEILYTLGLIHDKMDDKAAALDCFKQIYEVDYGYRDVAQRVESSYS